MAFTVPQFPLTCDIYAGPWVTKVLRLNSPCNLGQGRRVMPNMFFEPTAPEGYTTTSQLLLPALTDVRDGSCMFDTDIVEVPAGSGRWYSVLTVDDIGKGFPNEHRFALLHKIWERLNPPEFPGADWPAPIP